MFIKYEEGRIICMCVYFYRFSEHWLQGSAEVLEKIHRKHLSNYTVQEEKSLQGKISCCAPRKKPLDSQNSKAYDVREGLPLTRFSSD